MKKAFLALLLAVLLRPASAPADFLFPSSLTSLGDEAFAGAALPAFLTLPDTLESLGEGVFRGCTALREITIPASVTSIGEGALSGCGDALWVHCAPGSAARAYAAASGLDWDADTVYRALVIGQTYTGTSMALRGPANDAKAVRDCLASLPRNPFTVRQVSNATASALLSSVQSAFSGATADDVSLLYFSGHGYADGSLLGSDLETVDPYELRAALDTVPGRKILVVDACFSGTLITEGAARSRSVPWASFVQAFQAAFRPRTRGAFNQEGYYVLTAAQAEQESMEDYIISGGVGKIMGFFTYGLCQALGWNPIRSAAVSPSGDLNGDGAVSIQEAYASAAAFASSRNADQSAMVWPTGITAFAPFRFALP